MLWLFVRPTGVCLLDFFCSGIQFYLRLSSYLCFISFLYLYSYVLGDGAFIYLFICLFIYLLIHTIFQEGDILSSTASGALIS